MTDLSVLVRLDSIHGTTLADEFPFGSDTIQHVAEALIALRSERRYTVAEIRARLERVLVDEGHSEATAAATLLRLLARAFASKAND